MKCDTFHPALHLKECPFKKGQAKGHGAIPLLSSVMTPRPRARQHIGTQDVKWGKALGRHRLMLPGSFCFPHESPRTFS